MPGGSAAKIVERCWTGTKARGEKTRRFSGPGKRPDIMNVPGRKTDIPEKYDEREGRFKKWVFQIRKCQHVRSFNPRNTASRSIRADADSATGVFFLTLFLAVEMEGGIPNVAVLASTGGDDAARSARSSIPVKPRVRCKLKIWKALGLLFAYRYDRYRISPATWRNFFQESRHVLAIIFLPTVWWCSLRGGISTANREHMLDSKLSQSYTF